MCTLKPPELNWMSSPPTLLFCYSHNIDGSYDLFVPSNDLAKTMTDSDSRVKTQFSLGLFADDAAFWRVGIVFG